MKMYLIIKADDINSINDLLDLFDKDNMNIFNVSNLDYVSIFIASSDNITKDAVDFLDDSEYMAIFELSSGRTFTRSVTELTSGD